MVGPGTGRGGSEYGLGGRGNAKGPMGGCKKLLYFFNLTLELRSLFF